MLLAQMSMVRLGSDGSVEAWMDKSKTDDGGMEACAVWLAGSVGPVNVRYETLVKTMQGPDGTMTPAAARRNAHSYLKEQWCRTDATRRSFGFT